MSVMTAGQARDVEVETIRDRIVVAATQLTTSEGWASVTMSRLADIVGVSRQTVYNEIGTKPALAEAMILNELALFLDRVDQAFGAHPDNLVEAIREAVRGVLEFAQDNKLLHAVVSATHGADTELLPLLTTHAGALMETAKIVIADHLAAYEIPIADDELAAAVDAIVRVALSHVMQPSAPPSLTADGIAWIAERVLGTA
jgi:AcrR family transcriptional regulator